jgi:SulP family sulfate permease
MIDVEGFRHILIVSSGINFVDLAGAEMFEQLARRLKALGGGLYFSDNKRRVCEYLRKGNFLENIGEENFFESKAEAIANIFPRLNPDICRHCEKRVFSECRIQPADSEEHTEAAPAQSARN